MLQFFLNPWMLFGLAGIALPIIAHLLVRRRYHVVDWGAMQFLRPGARTRRRLQLQDLLLLLVRIFQILLIVLALARPWIYDSLFSDYRSAGSRSVVLIIDGSASMARPDGITTLHQNALRRAADFLTSLAPTDTVTLIDGRDVPNVLIHTPTTNKSVVAERIKQIEPPGGYSNLQVACERALSLLVQANGRQRDIIVFTDSQRASWNIEDTSTWEQLDDLLRLTSVRPELWVMDCGARLSPPQNQISVGRLILDPSVAVPGSPVRITTSITNHSSKELQVPVELLVQNQQMPKQGRVNIVPPGETTHLQLFHQFSSPGIYRLEVRGLSDTDELTIDNSAMGIATVQPAIKVLLVESSDSDDPSQQRTLFVRAALSPPAEMLPWTQARVVPVGELSEPDIRQADVVVLQDVEALPTDSLEWLSSAVESGTGLLIATGPHTTPEFFDHHFVQSGLLPGARLLRATTADGDPPVVMASSLQMDWLRRFQEQRDGTLLKAVFRGWWDIALQDTDEGPTEGRVYPVARLTNNAPLLLQRTLGNGRILWLTTSLDTEWTNLPGQPDFVALLYEALFHLTQTRTNRNVLPGQQLIAEVDSAGPAGLDLVRPSGNREPAQTTLVRNSDESSQTLMRYDRVTMPGLYHLLDAGSDQQIDAFVADYDRKEDSVQQLTEADRLTLQGTDRLKFTDSAENLSREMYSGEVVTELWWLLLVLFLATLILESWMTRQLVIERHGLKDNGEKAEAT